MITFDGWSGAGKTTQAMSVANELNIKSCYYAHGADNNITNEVSSGSVAMVFESIHILGQSIKAKDRMANVFTLDECYFNLLHWMGIPKNFDDRECLLRLFREAMVDLLQREPLISFYLDVPYQESIKRAKIRNDSWGKFQIPDSALNTSGASVFDRQMREAVSFMTERLPFFQVIDGTQPMMEVTKECLRLIHLTQ